MTIKIRPRYLLTLAAVAVATLGLSSSTNAAEPVYSNAVLADNPLVYYQLDETGGTTAANSATTGATYTGTFNTAGGTVTVGQSSFLQGGTAYDFGGGFVGSASALSSSLTEWTVEAWVNYDSGKTSASNFLSNDQGGWNDDVLFGIGAENGGVGVPGGSVGVIHQDNANTTRDSVGSALAADEWHHIVMTGENGTGAGTSTLQLYIDGVLADSDATILGNVTFNGTGGVGSPNLTVGAARPNSGDGGYRPYDGLLDEVAIYDSVLSQNTIQTHYNTGINEAPIQNVPEPASIAIWSILGFCLTGYGYRRRRRNC